MGNARPPAYRRATYLNTPPTGTTPIHQRSRLPWRDERARSRRHESAPLRRRTQQHIRNPRPSLPENSNPRLASHATNEAQPRKNVTSGSSKAGACGRPHSDRSWLLLGVRVQPKQPSTPECSDGDQGAAMSDAHEPDSDGRASPRRCPAVASPRSGAMAVTVRCREFAVRLKCSNFSGAR